MIHSTLVFPGEPGGNMPQNAVTEEPIALLKVSLNVVKQAMLQKIKMQSLK